MAAAISEEKVSSDLENSINKGKLIDNEDSNEINNDAVLDEMAAKVKNLDIEDENDEDSEHNKYIETIKKQGETINTLVRQLRVFFDDYQEINREKEYYEELNDALIRCLEITEGKLEIYDSDLEIDEETKQNENPEEIKNETNEDIPNEKTAVEKSEVNVENVKDQDSQDGDANNENKETEDEPTENQDDEEIEPKKLTKRDLLKINHILLREIYDLRYQLTSIAEQIRFENGEESDEDGIEYDSTTDSDTHVCEHCSAEKLEVSAEKESGEENQEEENQEEYEQVEDKAVIKDETDTE